MAEGTPLGPGEIGASVVRIEANVAPLQAGLKQAEAATAASGVKMGENLKAGVAAGVAGAATAASAGAGGAAGGMFGAGGMFAAWGTSIKGATAGIRSAVGAVTSVIGVATRLLGIVGLITSGVYVVNSILGSIRGGASGAADEADRMKKNLSDAEDVGARLRKELEEANKQLGEAAINPQAVDPAAFNKAKSDVTTKAFDLSRTEQLIRLYTEELKRGGMAPEERRVALRELEYAKEASVRQKEDLALLEAILDNLTSGRDAAFKRIIEAATAKIIAIQREQTNKLLESIAFDSARARQVAEEMQGSQFRGP